MADSNRSAGKPGSLAALLPLIAVFGGLFVAWCLSVVWLRQMTVADGWAKQSLPLLLWLAAIALFVAWQRPREPATWTGLLPVDLRVILMTLVTFAAVFAWHAIRIAVGRPPSDLLFQLPPEILAWMLAGIFLNELLFHGILQTRLTELLGPKVAIAVTGVVVLLFRLPSFHVAGSLGVDPVMLSTILLLSLVAGVLRFASGSLWPAIAIQAAHALGTLL